MYSKRFPFLSWLWVTLCLSSVVKCLEPYRFFGEGPCSRIQSYPIHDLNRSFLDSLRYIQEGSRYYLYRQASLHFEYDTLLEDDLTNEFCLQRNVSTQTESSIGTLYGFGRILRTFPVRVPKGNESQPGLYFQSSPRDSSWDVAKHFVTVTDNRNFAVEVTCWTGSNQVGWALLSTSPYVSEPIRTFAMDHASRMGFDSRHFIVLHHHQNCGPEGQRNKLRHLAGDAYNFLNLKNRPGDARIGVPYQSSYIPVSISSSPGNWNSRPYVNYNRGTNEYWRDQKERQRFYLK